MVNWRTTVSPTLCQETYDHIVTNWVISFGGMVWRNLWSHPIYRQARVCMYPTHLLIKLHASRTSPTDANEHHIVISASLIRSRNVSSVSALKLSESLLSVNCCWRRELMWWSPENHSKVTTPTWYIAWTWYDLMCKGYALLDANKKKVFGSPTPPLRSITITGKHCPIFRTVPYLKLSTHLRRTGWEEEANRQPTNNNIHHLFTCGVTGYNYCGPAVRNGTVSNHNSA